jgi:hypothetical protein
MTSDFSVAWQCLSKRQIRQFDVHGACKFVESTPTRRGSERDQRRSVTSFLIVLSDLAYSERGAKRKCCKMDGCATT